MKATNLRTNERAIAKSGLVAHHALQISSIASKEDIYILMRPVNEKSTSLIDANYATKNLHIKAKSSDWGPQAGFVCTDSNLSKLYGNEKRLKENDDQINEIKLNHFAIEVPLLLTKERLIELCNCKSIVSTNSMSNPLLNFDTHQFFGIKDGNRIDEYLFHFMPITKEICFEAKEMFSTKLFNLNLNHISNENKFLFQIQFEKIKSHHFERYVVFYQKMSNEKDFSEDSKKLLMVLAKPPSKLNQNINSIDEVEGGCLPFTSDYDVFAIYPNLSRYANNYNKKKHELGNRTISQIEKFRMAIKTVIDATGARQRRYIHENYEKMSYFFCRIIRMMNEQISELGYFGGDVIQHGAEVDNRSSVNIDFPVTLFTPKGRIISIEDKSSLQITISEIKLLGYAVYINIRWQDINYSEAMKVIREIIDRKGLKEENIHLYSEALTEINLNYVINRIENEGDLKGEKKLFTLSEEFLHLEESQKIETLNLIQKSMQEYYNLNPELKILEPELIMSH